ncbi:hypothetical protein RJD24_17410 [Bacillaceae bacterium IKA-2]|jgi:uncharacterized protein YcfL|nr:hypothetical protein RJD24_17410 [Bacillaceae bacterium IKA-2]
MKKRLIFVILFISIVALVACSSDGGKESNGSERLAYTASEFEISLPDNSGNLVNVSPDGKTIYAYFTGIS